MIWAISIFYFCCIIWHHYEIFKLYRKLIRSCFVFSRSVFELHTERSQQLSKMATGEEKAFAVLEFHSYQSVITVQRQFRTKFEKDVPCVKSIRRWYAQFKATGCLCKGKSTGRPPLSEEKVEIVRVNFTRILQNSTRKASREQSIPQPTVRKIIRKRLQPEPYHLQLPVHPLTK